MVSFQVELGSRVKRGPYCTRSKQATI